MNTIQSVVLSKRNKYTGTAIECGSKKISYSEFDLLTDKIATGLSDNGIRPGDKVIINLGRSIEMVLAMFGILKTGAAFVPIAKDTPAERLNSIMKTSGAKLVFDMNYYEQIASKSDRCNVQFEPIMASEDDPAIVLYTSGSTGEPKGVCQNQAAVKLLFEQFPYNINTNGIAVEDFDTCIARLNYAFIVAYHYEYPVALLNGKKLVLLNDDEQNSIVDTCRVLEENERCLVAILPSQLAVYMENDSFKKAMRHIKCLCFFAEPVAEYVINSILEVDGFEGSVVSVYGTTETFGVAWQDFRDSKRGMIVSNHVDFKLLDDEGKDTLVDCMGEIVVKSPTIFSEYYMTDSDLCNRSFDAKNLYIDSKRYVRTGDMGIRDESGRITLCGRNDRMVKFHGQRVELPEIENVIKRFEGIRNCCAILGKGKSGKKLLVAYYEGVSEQEIDEKSLTQYIKDYLPPYMIPSMYIKLPIIPLNANGKIDYKQLSAIEIEDTFTVENIHKSDEEKAKETTQEKLIISESANILKMSEDAISVTSNLKMLGMDSLMVVLLISALREAGYVLTIEDYVSASNVSEIAKSLKKKDKDLHKASKEESDVYECTQMQSLWVKERFVVVSNFLAYIGIDEEIIANRVAMLSRKHQALRSEFYNNENIYKTKVVKDKAVNYDYYDARRLLKDGEISPRQSALINMKTMELFSGLSEDAMFHLCVVRLKDDLTCLIMACDHRVVDGMSEKVLFDELTSGFENEENDKYIEYLDYINSDINVEAARSFYREYVSGSRIVPVTLNKEHTGKPNIKSFGITIEKNTIGRLEEVWKKENVSAFAYIMYQYARTHMELSGFDDIIIPMGCSGRCLDLDSMNCMVGCLVNQIPVRCKKTDSINDFMKSYLIADKYGFIKDTDIFEDDEDREKLNLVPSIMSEIFPGNVIRTKWSYFREPSFLNIPRGNFLWEDDAGMHITFHIDTDIWDEEYIQKMVNLFEVKLNAEN